MGAAQDELSTLSKRDYNSREKSEAMNTLIELARITLGRESEALQAAMSRIDASFERAVAMLLAVSGKVILPCGQGNQTADFPTA